jgi:hypothetical protein
VRRFSNDYFIPLLRKLYGIVIPIVTLTDNELNTGLPSLETLDDPKKFWQTTKIIKHRTEPEIT